MKKNKKQYTMEEAFDKITEDSNLIFAGEFEGKYLTMEKDKGRGGLVFLHISKGGLFVFLMSQYVMLNSRYKYCKFYLEVKE